MTAFLLWLDDTVISAALDALATMAAVLVVLHMVAMAFVIAAVDPYRQERSHG